MMKVIMNNAAFKKDMKNIIDYSIGFLEGVKVGKTPFLNNMGIMTKELLEQYIDSNARVNPEALHHIYEWYKVGSPDARLYDINYTISNLGLSFVSTLKQSTSIKDGSSVPFYNKAKIMEEGSPVTIRPRKSNVLVFEDGGETVFTKGEVFIQSPGGPPTKGAFENVVNTFFNRYFTQAFLRTSGISQYLSNPVVYKANLKAGKSSGKSRGYQVGYRWIANAGIR
jgi:hypothetical protein